MKIDLKKNGGFYSVYGDDAFILFYFFDYKISDYKVGFPLSAYNKVINKLEENCISYKDELNNVIVDFKRKNKYSYFVAKGKSKYSLKNRVNAIVSKLDALDENKIDEILNYIEEMLWTIDF